jgi:hypothetical protein
VPSHPAPQSSADNDSDSSSGCAADRRGVSLRDINAWRQLSPVSWSAGNYTICAVRVSGEIHYELWHVKEFLARADTAAKLRDVAASRGHP